MTTDVNGKKAVSVRPKRTLQERVFKYTWISITIYCLTFIPGMIQYREFALANGAPTYTWQSLWIALAAAIVVMAIRYGAYPLLHGPFDRILDVKYGPSTREAAIEKLNKWFFDVFYYSATTVIGILILGQNSYLPSLFGGSGNCLNIMEKYPFVDELPYLQVFYLIQIGHHFFSMVDQILTKRNTPDYHEIMLHHVLTVALMVSGYLVNIVVLGTVTTVILDPTDVLLCLVRFSGDVKVRTSLVVPIFVTTILGWLYLRLIYFPTCVLPAMWHAYTHPIGEMVNITGQMLFFQIALLALLVPLSAYWVYRITRKGITLLIKEFRGKPKTA